MEFSVFTWCPGLGGFPKERSYIPVVSSLVIITAMHAIFGFNLDYFKLLISAPSENRPLTTVRKEAVMHIIFLQVVPGSVKDFNSFQFSKHRRIQNLVEESIDHESTESA
jgi:hypothetical protein